MPRQVDYYFSLQSPWAYVGHQSFRRLVSIYDLTVNHKPVVLVDLFSETGGLPLMKRHPVRQRYRMVELQRWRDKRGLTFHLQPANWPFNARLVDVDLAVLQARRRREEPGAAEDEAHGDVDVEVAMVPSDQVGLDDLLDRFQGRRDALGVVVTGSIRITEQCDAEQVICS